MLHCDEGSRKALVCISGPLKSVEGSVSVEKLTEVIRGDVPAGLPENGMTGSRVKLPMVRNRQRLLFSCRANPSQFDMAPGLLKDYKAEALKNRNGVRPRQPP
jgi:hypothetical protein